MLTVDEDKHNSELVNRNVLSQLERQSRKEVKIAMM